MMLSMNARDSGADLESSFPRGSSPSVLWLTAEEVPRGFWRRDDHRPFPVTRLYADFDLGRHIPEGRNIAREEYSGPAAAMQSAVIDGYAYDGVDAASYAPDTERIAAFEAKIERRHEEVVLARWRESDRPRAIAALERLRREDPGSLGDAELLRHIGRLSDALVRWYGHHFTNTRAAGIVIDRARAFCREQLDLPDDRFLALLAGSSPATTGAVHDLKALARTVIGDPSLRRSLESGDALSDSRVRSLLRPYLDQYGYRTGDFDYTMPALIEQPERVVAELRSEVARIRDGEGAITCEQPSDPGDGTALIARLSGESRTRAFRVLLTAARGAYGVRDDDIGICLTGAGLMRRALLESGRRLTADRRLLEPEHVLHLRRSELEAALAGKQDDFRTLSEARMRERQARFHQTPPFSFGQRPPDPSRTLPLSEAARASMSGLKPWFIERAGEAPNGMSELRGIPASAGRYSGTARIVANEDEFDRILPGDVLVSAITTPTWNVVFGEIGAMVVEVGSVVSHAAIAARELGLPAVVAVRDATRIIRDGQQVLVDGTAGSVWH